MAPDHDVFVSYSRDDAAFVERVDRRLVDEFDYRVFLAPWSLAPGDRRSAAVVEALRRSATCVVFIGPTGVASWAREEASLALELRARFGSLRVIPVFLPGVTPALRAQLPPFLETLASVALGSTDDELAAEVLAAAIRGHAPPPPTRDVDARPDRRASFVAHALPAALAFQERPELEALREFWHDPRGGVLALVGLGGSGKTALAARFCQEIADAVFVWSLYEQPDIEKLFAALHRFVVGGEPAGRPARDLSWRVTRALEHAGPGRRLILLDGVEVVQVERPEEGSPGVLRDSSLRHLLRHVAHGRPGVHVIVTSRFALPDLARFAGDGYRVVATDQLAPASARLLLRARGVQGSDDDLDELLRSFGRHALTLDHLGTLLHDHFGGDPARASELPPAGPAEGAAAADDQSLRLARVFAFYAAHLPPAELRVLQVLSACRIPLGREAVAAVVDAWSTKAPPPLDASTVRAALARLRARRLISLGDGEESTCSVHPSVRDCFYRSFHEGRESAHASVVDHLVSLAGEPHRRQAPTTAALLDLHETLIDHSIRGGRLDAAVDSYHYGLGGYRHLAWRLAEYQRGQRITGWLAAAGGIDLRYVDGASAWQEHALFEFELGRTRRAEDLLRDLLSRQSAKVPGVEGADGRARMLNHIRTRSYSSDLTICLADVLIARGRLPEAAEIVAPLRGEESQRRAMLGKRWNPFEDVETGPFARSALARFLLGDVDEAERDFEAADAPASWRGATIDQLFGDAVLHRHLIRAECACRRGRFGQADRILQRFTVQKAPTTSPGMVARHALVQSDRCRLGGSNDDAIAHAEAALGWSIGAGQRETYGRANLALARAQLYRHADAGPALAEAEETARDCDLRLLLIDTLVTAGYAALRGAGPEEATRRAEEAHALAADPTCGYAWGLGDACHLAAVIAARRGDVDAMLLRGGEALALRTRIGDPREKNTRRLLTNA